MSEKFDKKKCSKCQYRGALSTMTYCNYASITGETCLRRNRNGSLRDIRGEGPGCLLYCKGEQIIKEKDDNQIHYGHRRTKV